MHETDKIVTDDGEFHVVDDDVDLSPVTTETWIALGFFWLLALTVFFQFFTRYVLNNSAAWTEETARYLLIATVFVGAAVGVTKNNHIQVDFFYRFMPKPVARSMAVLVDGIRIVFFCGCGMADLFNDEEDGRLQDDHHRFANEPRLWRLPVRFCGHAVALCAGGPHALAARLQRA